MGDVEFPDRWSTATQRYVLYYGGYYCAGFGVYSVLDANRGRVFTYDNNELTLYVRVYWNESWSVSRPVAMRPL